MADHQPETDIVKILLSKLAPPMRHNILHRKRLTNLFGDIRLKKLITVIAGAGYGKTTLTHDALSASGGTFVWYRLDDQDNDFQVFVSYLYAAFTQKAIPTFSLKRPDDIMIEWLSFMEKRLVNPTILVLDDYHLVQDTKPVNQAVEFILERLPKHLHLVIIGRRELPLKLSRLRAQELILEINEQDLAFTKPEIKQFFDSPHPLADISISDISTGTQGWAAALVLLRYTLKGKHPDDISDRMKNLKQVPQYIFSYLKENIFDTQPDHIKNFMIKTALLSEIDTRICGKIFDIHNAGDILQKLANDHLLVFPVDDSGTVYTLHHLLREFLTSQINQTFCRDDIDALHFKIAKEAEADDIFQALTHYIDGHAFEEAIRLIETHEMKFLIQGKVNFLGQCLAKIPDQIIDANPKLLLAQAKLFSHFGKPRKARGLIMRAHLLFKKQNAKDEMVASLVELGSQYYFTGHVREAKLLMEQVLDDVDTQSTAYVVAMTYLTFLSAVLGSFEDSDSHLEAAKAVIEEYPEFERKTAEALLNTSLTHTLYFKGDFEGSYHLSRKLLKKVIALNIEPCLPLVYYQLAADCFFLENYSDGCGFAQRGIEACEKMALSDSRKGWVLLSWAQNLLGQGKLDQAKAMIDKSSALFEEPGNRWGLANAWECLHQVCIAEGNRSRAKQMIDRALDIVHGHGLEITQGMLENSKAALFIDENQPDKALDLLSKAFGRLEGAEYHLFNNQLLTAKVLIRLNKLKKAAENAALAFELMEKNDYLRFLHREKGWLIPFLEKYARTGTRPNKKFNDIIKQVLPNKKGPPVLYISLFGPFRADIGDEKIPVPVIKSASALTLFKYLAANRKRGFIHKDELIELLWPEENPQKTGSRFNMAMSALRKALEPDLPPKAASSYIERQKDRYRFYDDQRVIVDTERFSGAASRALKTPVHHPDRHDMLIEAESIYTGPFLEEDRYEDFCIEKREMYAKIYGQLVKTIANSFETKKNIENAILYTRKALNLEAFDEAGFKKLMNLYSQTNDHLKIRQTFQKYKKMIEEMDLPLNPEIMDQYNRLTEKKNSRPS